MSEIRKTFSHLAAGRRMPTEYELVTTDLLYYVSRGFEVETPVGSWYGRYQRESALRLDSWGAFKDPAERTYTSYTRLQTANALHVDRLLGSLGASSHWAGIDSKWKAHLGRVLGPLRFALHGLQMASAYVGSMAPEGRVVVCCLLQAADEVRRIQVFARLLGLLRRDDPKLAARARQDWQSAPAWQPLRAVIETLLVTYDFGEALVAMNLCVKPLLDLGLLEVLAASAARTGDALTHEVLMTLADDASWQRAWTSALVGHLGAGSAARDAVRAWTAQWMPRSVEAVLPLTALAASHDDSMTESALARHRQWLAELGIGEVTA